jgi:hypothetical protein
MEQSESNLPPELNDLLTWLDLHFQDLVGVSKHAVFFEKLFACEKGKWCKVVELCDTLPECTGFAESLRQRTSFPAWVVWLDYPDPAIARQFAHFAHRYIHFCLPLDGLLWSWALVWDIESDSGSDEGWD